MNANNTVRIELSTIEDAARQLALRLHGELVRPNDSAYEAARHVWDAGYDRRPAMIARCTGVSDVIAAVKVARSAGLPVAVRSGGHGFAGHGTVDGGLVIDLSPMKGIRIDPERRIARIEPGLTWGEVAAEAHAFGLALTSGDMASVGVGGLTLGGGIGWMVRKHGLTVDNLRSVDLVTASGQFLTASADENAELFWGLRGGGGNFGIATAFEFNLHPAGLIVGGAVFYDAADAATVLPAFASYAASAPEELTATAMIMNAPPLPFIPPTKHGTPVLALLLCYTGDLAEGQRVVAPLSQLAVPIADVVGPMPYPVLLAMTADAAVPGWLHADRSLFLESLDNAALRTIVEQSADITPGRMAQLRILGGALRRTSAGETAFAHRDKAAAFTIINSWADPDQSAEQGAWTERFWQAMRGFGSGVYANFLGAGEEDRINDAYPAHTYERLARLKNRYDPTNLFRLNHNIAPTAEQQCEQVA